MADRVPAPSSRIPAVGTAQPYYQGGALPATQPVIQPLGAAQPANDITPIPADGIFAASRIAPPVTSIEDDVAVSIPTDESTMRFAATPQPAALTVTSPQEVGLPPTVVTTATNTVQPQVTPTTKTLYRESNNPATTTPAITNWPPVDATLSQPNYQAPPSAGNASGYFRDPILPTQAPPLLQSSPTGTPTIATPRVRVPGSAERIREEIVPGTISTTSYQVGPSGEQQGHTMSIPPVGYVPASFDPGTPLQQTAPADGFRPRGSSSSVPPRSQVPTLVVTPG